MRKGSGGMLTFKPSQNAQTVAFEFDGRLTKEDVMKMEEVLQQKYEEGGTFNLFAEIGTIDFPSIPEALRDVQIDMAHWMAFDKLALMSGQNWLEFAAAFGMDEIARQRARYFEPGQYEKAWAWLEE